MPAIYTDEQLILYIYNEMSTQESQVMQYMIMHDEELNGRYQVLHNTILQLDTLKLEPHPSSVEIIFEQTDHLEPTC